MSGAALTRPPFPCIMGTNTKTRQGRCLFLPKEDDIMRTKNISLLLALTLLLTALAGVAGRAGLPCR